MKPLNFWASPNLRNGSASDYFGLQLTGSL